MSLEVREIPQEVKDAALLVGTYAAKEGWQGDWALIGLCSRSYREKELSELREYNAALRDTLRGQLRKLIEAI